MAKKEKRHFKRYKRLSIFNLLIKGRSFKAKIIDYSLNGIGAMIEDNPPVKEGDIVDLNITEPDIKTSGKIVWSKRVGSGLKIGIRKIESLKGQLRDYELADTITGLQRSNKTGILEVISGAIIKKIYIKNGDMIFAASNQNEDRLGDVLLREKRITLAQYDQSVEEMKKTKQRQGAALVRLGYLTPQQLVWAVMHHSEEIILSIFSMRDGSFEFKEGPLPTDETITLRLSAANLIYKGIKRIADISSISNSLPSQDAVLYFSSDPLKLFQDLSLDEAGKKILSGVDGKTSIKGMADILDNYEALKTIYALLSIGIIMLKEETSETGEEAAITADEIIREPESNIPQEVRERINDIYNRYDNLGYYGILDIKKDISPDGIKKAYYKVAKEFHPDRHFYIGADELKTKLNAIFSYVTLAYTTLSNPEKRKEYDRRLSIKSEKEISKEELASERFEEGKTELAKQNIVQAMELFGQAAYLNNSAAKYHYYYGLSLNGLNRFKEAARAIERALMLEPSNADYLAEAGHIYLKLEFHSRAKSSFEKALKLSPSNQRAKEGLMSFKE